MSLIKIYTGKPTYNDHPWDPKIVVVVDRWSSLTGHLCIKISKWNFKMSIGFYSEGVISLGLAVVDYNHPGVGIKSNYLYQTSFTCEDVFEFSHNKN